ncbi:MAG: AMP-binding protein [Chloroflexi bacterium]|nr:AMP-binding protein [Chloroflexota bacterium]
MIEFLLKVFDENKNDDAIIWRDQPFAYSWLTERISAWQIALDKEQVQAGSVVILEADFSPNAIALFLALIERNCVIVPLTKSIAAKKADFMEIAEGEVRIAIDDEDAAAFEKLPRQATHPLYAILRGRRHPGLILFSSGSTGKSKAALHDLTGILEKFKVCRNRQRAITFLLYDHIGGVNTMLYTLSNGGCIITVQERTPEKVLEAAQKYHATLLPTSPKQTYGLSEVGILRSKSKSSDSLWVKIGGEGFETRIVDGILHIKAQSAMLGYLNAPSPFSEDGWFITGDEVQVDGDYYRILGRRSELINVGGEKVYPAEVESTLLLMEGVDDVVVTGETNQLSGQIVVAKINLSTAENLMQFRQRMRQFCKDKLAKYKIPQKVILLDQPAYSQRFKKMRL